LAQHDLMVVRRIVSALHSWHTRQGHTQMEQQSKSLPIREAYRFAEAHGLHSEIDEIKKIDPDAPWARGLRKAYIIDLFERRGLFEQFKNEHWPYGDSPGGKSKQRFYLGLKARHDETEPDADAAVETTEEAFEEAVEEAQSFAAEADLRDFLAKNPDCIERGLSVYSEGGRSGVEYAIDGGRIDILAVDKDQRLVVIELKVGRGRNKTIGQLLYYMGWVDKNLAKDVPCRGMIVAKDISEDLITAVRRVPDVSLCRYKLSVTVEQV